MVEINISKALRSGNNEFTLSADFKFNRGDYITVYGPSGAGKTSLLRIIAGLLRADHGMINVDNEIWYSSEAKKNLKASQRSVGLVFQDYSLFPNLSVAGNIKYGIQGRSDLNFFHEVISLMDLEDLLERSPETLSGGQKQRVALARSLVTMPRLLMLDEPLSALDISMRQNIQEYLLQAHKKYKLTIIMVTHDIAEIFKLSNRVIHLKEGKIIEDGPPSVVFFHKNSTGRFQFVGEVLAISEEEVVFIITVLIGQQIVKVVAEEGTVEGLVVGDKVMVTSKAFNPIIQKILD